MFFYATSSKFQFNLKINLLLEHPEWLEQVAKWIEGKWGYIRHFPGIDRRKEMIKPIQNHFHIITYAGQPIGMFALFDHHGINPTFPIQELMYFYVDESFRGLGIGKKMMDIAKEIAENQGAKMIILDTLNPNLNRFYEKQGAKAICESQCLGQPTTLFRI